MLTKITRRYVVYTKGIGLTTSQEHTHRYHRYRTPDTESVVWIYDQPQICMEGINVLVQIAIMKSLESSKKQYP